MVNGPFNPDASFFENLLQAAPDPILIVAEGGAIAMANLEAEAKLGYEKNELIGMSIEALVPARFRAKHAGQRDAFEAAPHTRPMGLGIDLTAVRKDGREIPVEISLSPMWTRDGRFVISIIRDISERKQAETALRAKADELARSNGELEQFAYIASHDLQEPLRAIAGACQLLQRRYGGRLDADADEFVGIAVDGAKRLQELISDLLDYSRVTSKGREPIPVDVETTLAKAKANLSMQIVERNAAVTYDPLPTVTADPVQMVQLFQNLINNGLKFNEAETPTVHLSAAREGDFWHFSVRDNGIGVDPKYFDRLFVIFKRLHARTDYPGTGLGLALCKKIVERHGGRIWIDSAPGAGSTFHFTLRA